MKKIIAAAAAGVLLLTLTACGTSDEYQERKESQSTALPDSLSRDNQEERLAREEDESQVRYVYILAPFTGEAIGYYTVNGKVSSAGVQNAPEQELIRPYNGSSDLYIVDSAKDDGTYGPSETGFFFFTTENVLIEIEGLAYVQSDSPIRLFIDAPLLNEE